MFSTLSKTILNLLVAFIFSYANAFNLDYSKILVKFNQMTKSLKAIADKLLTEDHNRGLYLQIHCSGKASKARAPLVGANARLWGA